jgi:hypothetical protein
MIKLRIEVTEDGLEAGIECVGTEGEMMRLLGVMEDMKFKLLSTKAGMDDSTTMMKKGSR